MTTGESMIDIASFNTFFIPHAVVQGGIPGDISSDFDYSSNGNEDRAVDWTFQPVNHPCTSARFDASTGNTQAVSTCCITNPRIGRTAESTGGFVANYRPTQAFVSWADDELQQCAGAGGEQIDRPGFDDAFDVKFPSNPVEFLSFLTPTYGGSGKFKDMNRSPGVVNLAMADPFFGQFKFEIHFDEVELRSLAGKLKGSVNIEHTVDTFLGLANFRTTGLVALDTFTTQVPIHLEKTGYFTVASVGSNDYTFLEYVNLRLITLLDRRQGSVAVQSEDRLDRTNTANNVNFVQVTFMLGQKYVPNDVADSIFAGGLIPLDSVRAGIGGELDSTDMEHLCGGYQRAAPLEQIGLAIGRVDKQAFDASMSQACAPAALMCENPESLPDSFVSFNIPLGMDVFRNRQSITMEHAVFVDMVISAVDSVAREAPTDPNAGEAPWQMKTTLSATIPIVEGGVYVFCDVLAAKTDLRDVADADIVVGTAKDASELSRLRVLQDIGSQSSNRKEPSRVDSDSIEAALMTLVIKGNSSYFARAVGGVSLELDELITLHLMTDGEAPSGDEGSIDASIQSLLLASGDSDNDDEADSKDADGYRLNGAFRFEIDRANGVAQLHPTDELAALCPFLPTPPQEHNAPLQSCITRRDVHRRGFPMADGRGATAMEILAPGVPAASTEAATNARAAILDEASSETVFLTSVLGESNYTLHLAPQFVRTIHQRYHLDGRTRRAFWINPAYEWTPAQTGGKPLFSVSQKIYLFALISLDENLDPLSNRRLLLQTTADPTKETGSAVGSAVVEFQTSRKSLMANAFAVPEERVAIFHVEVQLTKAQACIMDASDLQFSLRSTFSEYLEETASSFHTVQVFAIEKEMNTEHCFFSTRRLSSAHSSAIAKLQMMIVFKEDQAATFDLGAFSELPAIHAAEQDSFNSGFLRINENFVVDEEGLAREEASGQASGGLIVGLLAGVAAVVIIASVAVLIYKRSRTEMVAEIAGAVSVAAMSVQDLKAQELQGHLEGEDAQTISAV